MSDRIDFEIACPNNHDQTVTFSGEEFESALKSGALMFHCTACDRVWPPTREEIAGFRKQFPKKPASSALAEPSDGLSGRVTKS
jgi:hypothetical protein